MIQNWNRPFGDFHSEKSGRCVVLVLNSNIAAYQYLLKTVGIVLSILVNAN